MSHECVVLKAELAQKIPSYGSADMEIIKLCALVHNFFLCCIVSTQPDYTTLTTLPREQYFHKQSSYENDIFARRKFDWCTKNERTFRNSDSTLSII